MNGARPECVYGIQHTRCTLFGRESLEASQLGLTDSQSLRSQEFHAATKIEERVGF
jgi:hypothetical protein